MPLTLSGDGSIGPLSATEVEYLDGVSSSVQTQINSKASTQNTTLTGNVVLPYNLSSGGTNIVNSKTIIDSSAVDLTNVQNNSGILFVYTGQNQTTAIPFYSNGGAGIAYKWTVLDPDTGWNVNWSGSFSFAQAGSGSHTFTVSFGGGNGMLSIQRTAGTGTYYTKLMILGAW